MPILRRKYRGSSAWIARLRGSTAGFRTPPLPLMKRAVVGVLHCPTSGYVYALCLFSGESGDEGA